MAGENYKKNINLLKLETKKKKKNTEREREDDSLFQNEQKLYVDLKYEFNIVLPLFRTETTLTVINNHEPVTVKSSVLID